MTVRNSQKGISVMNSHHVAVADTLVEHIGQEAIHLKNNTSDSVVVGNTVRDTGLQTKTYGEGVYVGTAKGNWCKYNGCKPDASNRNAIVSNTISKTSSTGEVGTMTVVESESAAAAGLFALAVKLATVVIVAVRAFGLAWPPLAYSVRDDDEARRGGRAGHEAALSSWSALSGVPGGRPAPSSTAARPGSPMAGVPDQVAQRHPARPLDVRGARHEPDHVRVPGPELLAVFDQDDPLAGIDVPNLIRQTGDVIEDEETQRAVGEGYDVLCSNIIANVVIALGAQAPRLVKKGGLWIASGIILDRQADVEDAMRRAGFTVVDVRNKGEWVAILARKD